MQSTRATDLLKLVMSILVCLGAGFLGSFFTAPAIPVWYASLIKPSFNPPSWVFGPVWTTLYILMGISLFLIWRRGMRDRTAAVAIIFFIVQLLLNPFWSGMFFGLRSPLAGLITIVVLWIFTLLTIIFFARISRLAGMLLVPYILWISFASVLNYFLWKLNS